MISYELIEGISYSVLVTLLKNDLAPNPLLRLLDVFCASSGLPSADSSDLDSLMLYKSKLILSRCWLFAVRLCLQANDLLVLRFSVFKLILFFDLVLVD